MTNASPTMQRPPSELAKVEKSIEYVPFGAEDKIKLSVSIVRSMVATPTKQGDLPDDRDCMRFLMLCQAGRLNPFAGDCFLIGYRDRDSVVTWSLITSISAFRKRAETHPEYDGEESGCIVLDKDEKLVDRVGDFVLPTDQLVGGWARVHFKTRKHPMERRVQLATYQKQFGVWRSDSAGMIGKVAEAHALRDSFPTMLGGLYLEGEIGEAKPTANGKPGVRRLDDLNAAVVPHPSEPNRVIDTSESNLPPTEQAEKIIAEAPRAPERDPEVGGVDAEGPAPDLSSFEAFTEAARTLFLRDGLKDAAVFDAAMNKLRVSDGIGGTRMKDTQARNRIASAMEAGAFDWQSAKIV